MPSLILIAGPNGAGKTTFANRFLSGKRSSAAFLNADEIALNLVRVAPGPLADALSARLMLVRLRHLIEMDRDIVVESTLANRSYAVRIPKWQARGYGVVLIYLRLPSADAAIERVRRRVEAGGHGIPEEIIRRRYDRSLVYLDTLYKPIVDAWYVWDSLEGSFELNDAWDGRQNR